MIINLFIFTSRIVIDKPSKSRGSRIAIEEKDINVNNNFTSKL
jgi:hypothetical protein